MRFGIWYFGRIYRSGSMKIIASKLTKCNLDPVALQEVRWDKGGSWPADN
jgi:hypothetical protein